MTDSRPRYQVTHKEARDGHLTWWIHEGDNAHLVETHGEAMDALKHLGVEPGDLDFESEHDQFRFGLLLGIPLP